MANYKKTILNAKVNTALGCVFLGVWGIFCGMIMWQFAFGTNPISDAIIAGLPQQNNF